MVARKLTGKLNGTEAGSQKARLRTAIVSLRPARELGCAALSPIAALTVFHSTPRIASGSRKLVQVGCPPVRFLLGAQN